MSESETKALWAHIDKLQERTAKLEGSSDADGDTLEVILTRLEKAEEKVAALEAKPAATITYTYQYPAPGAVPIYPLYIYQQPFTYQISSGSYST